MFSSIPPAPKYTYSVYPHGQSSRRPIDSCWVGLTKICRLSENRVVVARRLTTSSNISTLSQLFICIVILTLATWCLPFQQKHTQVRRISDNFTYLVDFRSLIQYIIIPDKDQKATDKNCMPASSTLKVFSLLCVYLWDSLKYLQEHHKQQLQKAIPLSGGSVSLYRRPDIHWKVFVEVHKL